MKKYKLDSNDIKKLIEFNGGCIATDKITVDGMKVGYMYREKPSIKDDSGWRFFKGNEDESFTENADNFRIFTLSSLIDMDDSVVDYLQMNEGTSLIRIGNNKFIIDDKEKEIFMTK